MPAWQIHGPARGSGRSWRERYPHLGAMAARLRREHGLAKGGRVGLLTLGCPEYVIAYVATVSLGAIAVPLNLGLPAEDLAAQIDKVKA
jgi:fatty-acyl-CoA synthase